MKKIIDLLPKRTKVVRPEEYLDMSAEERSAAKRIDFVPPELGKKEFGHFIVTLKHPVYCLADGDE